MGAFERRLCVRVVDRWQSNPCRTCPVACVHRLQVVVRVRPVLPHELSDDVAVTCSSDARKMQVRDVKPQQPQPVVVVGAGVAVVGMEWGAVPNRIAIVGAGCSE